MKCPRCNYFAKSVHDYVKHATSHNNVSSKKQISCPHCPISCGSKSAFYIHLKTHQEDIKERNEATPEAEPEFYCNHCGHCFSTLKTYEDHIKEIPPGVATNKPYFLSLFDLLLTKVKMS